MSVPLQRGALGPLPPERVRKLRRHLIAAMRDLREAKRPERMLQRPAEEPVGFAATVVQESCALCQGHCCRGGGEDAYIDAWTMARVRNDRPELDARAIIRLYVEAVAWVGVAGSCVFHGAAGCTLDRSLRSHLCNSYVCSGLSAFLKQQPMPARVAIVAARGGQEERSPVLEGGEKAAG